MQLITAHAIVTNIQKRKLIKNQMDNDEINQENFAEDETDIRKKEIQLEEKADRLEEEGRIENNKK
ncbi:MAG: hypothetical protein ACLSG8_05595 [Barnesiella sp.]